MNDTARPYSLKKSRHVMNWIYSCYKQKAKKMPKDQREGLERDLSGLDQALLANNREEASQIAKRLEVFGDTYCKKTVFSYTWELIVALLFALVIATIVRQMWFELYEIPTGSMRPTFREQDHLTVTKTAFGINFPLETKHLYFDPALVQRSSVLIFSGDGLPLPDVDTTYFGIFPYKKRYIKRAIGKPGDALYFYGGRIYGVDSEGKDLVELRDSAWMENLEHIPFLSFEGEVSGNPTTVFFNQMHKYAGKVTVSALGQMNGQVYNGKEWVKDNPQAQATEHNTIKTYSDLMGIRNYAEARLLTKEEVEYLNANVEGAEDGVLYLQLHHTPSLNYPKPLIQRWLPGGIGLTGYSTIIPLQQHHLDKLMDHLYTARFLVKDGKGVRYGLTERAAGMDSPPFKGVPDGTYEFYFGKASKIIWGGIETDVPADSPLYSRSPSNVQKLFNLGIEMTTLYAPRPNNLTLFPHRYAYFRDGDLYLMGAPILKKDDPVLVSFLAREKQRQEKSTERAPYVAFRDYGAPFKKDGTIDADFIRTFGVVVPEKQYLVLGDNHAMSSDSRVFGFVPEDNLQGAPSLIIWPPGDRLGAPPQKPYPFMNVPRAIVWGIFGVIMAIWYAIHRWKLKQPIFHKIEV